MVHDLQLYIFGDKEDSASEEFWVYSALLNELPHVEWGCGFGLVYRKQKVYTLEFQGFVFWRLDILFDFYKYNAKHLNWF